MKRRTKIICTLGPASRRKETITKMAKAGMCMARLNFSHGKHSEHEKLIETIREVNQEFGYGIKILQDLEGYRIRIGDLARPLELIRHQQVWMAEESARLENYIPLDSKLNLNDFVKGMDVFVDDGRIHLKVLGLKNREGKRQLLLEVLHGGRLKSRKGVNIPKLKLKANILTEKDRTDIEFGLRHKVDYVAQSFVRNKSDIQRVSKLVKPHLPDCKILAKIENKDGVRNINKIIDCCDGIMVARGDLGVSLPIYQIPIIQKDIIKICNKRKRSVITATQMLESMTDNIRPTRAEVSDVANAIIDGTDYVMLSGETAAGAYPAKSVRMMCKIIEHTEKSLHR